MPPLPPLDDDDDDDDEMPKRPYTTTPTTQRQAQTTTATIMKKMAIKERWCTRGAGVAVLGLGVRWQIWFAVRMQVAAGQQLHQVMSAGRSHSEVSGKVVLGGAAQPPKPTQIESCRLGWCMCVCGVGVCG